MISQFARETQSPSLFNKVAVDRLCIHANPVQNKFLNTSLVDVSFIRATEMFHSPNKDLVLTESLS